MTDATTTETTQSSQGAQGQSSSAGSAATGATSQGSTASQTTSTQTDQSQQAATAPTRPDWLPENFFDTKAGPKWDDFGKHFSEIATRDAANEVRRLSLPQKPEDVKLELPKDFTLPQGVEFKLDPTKPEFNKFREIAVRRGLDNETITDLMGVYGETLVSSQATIAAAHADQVAKLGANGTARVTALGTFFDGMGTPELKGMLVTAAIVQAAERLVSKFSSQGAASFSQAHRVPGEGGGKVSDEEFAKMGPAARLDYARRFDQSQFQKAG